MKPSVNGIRRIVACGRPFTQHRGGEVVLDHWQERAAQRVGDALGLPHGVIDGPLERCEPTDFALYIGYWNEFLDATPTWSAEDHRMRGHGVALLDGDLSQSHGQVLEQAQAAFSLLTFDYPGRPASGTASVLLGRKDVAEAAGFTLNRSFHSQHYIAALSPPGMSREDMIARYLRTYWDMLGY